MDCIMRQACSWQGKACLINPCKRKAHREQIRPVTSSAVQRGGNRTGRNIRHFFFGGRGVDVEKSEKESVKMDRE